MQMHTIWNQLIFSCPCHSQGQHCLSDMQGPLNSDWVPDFVCQSALLQLGRLKQPQQQDWLICASLWEHQRAADQSSSELVVQCKAQCMSNHWRSILRGLDTLCKVPLQHHATNIHENMGVNIRQFSTEYMH